MPPEAAARVCKKGLNLVRHAHTRTHTYRHVTTALTASVSNLGGSAPHPQNFALQHDLSAHFSVRLPGVRCLTLLADPRQGWPLTFRNVLTCAQFANMCAIFVPARASHLDSPQPLETACVVGRRQLNPPVISHTEKRNQ